MCDKEEGISLSEMRIESPKLLIEGEMIKWEEGVGAMIV